MKMIKNNTEDEDFCDDGYCDIDDNNISEDECEDNGGSETKKEFQKFIKKISQAS